MWMCACACERTMVLCVNVSCECPPRVTGKRESERERRSHFKRSVKIVWFCHKSWSDKYLLGQKTIFIRRERSKMLIHASFIIFYFNILWCCCRFSLTRFGCPFTCSHFVHLPKYTHTYANTMYALSKCIEQRRIIWFNVRNHTTSLTVLLKHPTIPSVYA